MPQDVDARNKSGHDGRGQWRRFRRRTAPAGRPSTYPYEAGYPQPSWLKAQPSFQILVTCAIFPSRMSAT